MKFVLSGLRDSSLQGICIGAHAFAVNFDARIYGPSEFGVYAIFLSLFNIFNAISTLRFDQCIPIATERNKKCNNHSFALGCFDNTTCYINNKINIW